MEGKATMMTGMRFWRYAGAAILLYPLVRTEQPLFSQETAPPAVVAEASPTASDPLTVEAIDARLKQLEESKELNDATRSAVKEAYEKAKSALVQTATEQKEAVKFRSWIKTAESDLREAEHKTPKKFNLETVKDKALVELRIQLDELERQRDEAKANSEKLNALPQQRADRRTKIPKDTAEARKAIEELDKQLKVLETDTSAPMIRPARRAQLTVEKQWHQAIVDAREAERQAYDAQEKTLRLWIANAAAVVKQLDADVESLRRLVDDQRQYDAGEQLRDAEDMLKSAPDLLKPFWKKNTKLASQWVELADKIVDASQERDRLAASLVHYRDDFEQTGKRADKGTSDTLGQLLIRKRSSLPEISPLRQQIAARERSIREIQNQLYELEDRRSELNDQEAKAESTVVRLHERQSQLPDRMEQRLIDVYKSEALILDSLIADTNLYFSMLIDANEDQADLVIVLEQYTELIDQRVFWIRSASPPRMEDVSQAGRAIGWLFDPSSVHAAREAIGGRLKRSTASFSLGVIAIFGLFIVRRRVRRKIRALGELAARRSCRTFAPTFQSIAMSVLLATAWPLLLVFLGWGLSGSPDEHVNSMGIALTRLAVLVFILEVIAQLCRRQGVAGSHFNWPSRTVALIRANMRLMLLLGLPFTFVFMVLRAQENVTYHTSLGRLCFVASMLLLTFVNYRLFRPRGGAFEETLSSNPEGWLNRLRLVWSTALVCFPLALATLAIAGYYYTSWRLASDVVRTFILLFGILVVGATLYRWVRIKRRQLRWKQAMEHRERLANEGETVPSQPTELTQEEEEIDLAAIDQKTRRLIRSFLIFASLLGVWLIWANVLPMLSVLEEQVIWDSVTVSSLLFGVLVVCITFVAARNVPGLIDILLLERLAIESSVRYAISALSQYAIAAFGLITAAGVFGFSWDKVQWLVAALSVGLGFGLQEIVANFICGIILLFERPIRVNDVVTLGDTTGVVTKISIRATRVRNWDRQELVIPNKELITGRIINWTLSDHLNRIVLNVGIAYGSDTRRARELLYTILDEHPNVIDDPKALVTFSEFGDSTLNFVLRAYLSQMETRMETTHDLHTIIHERFGQEGIEIAFPQRDLHLRSVDQSVQLPRQNGTVLQHTAEFQAAEVAQDRSG